MTSRSAPNIAFGAAPAHRKMFHSVSRLHRTRRAPDIPTIPKPPGSALEHLERAAGRALRIAAATFHAALGSRHTQRESHWHAMPFCLRPNQRRRIRSQRINRQRHKRRNHHDPFHLNTAHSFTLIQEKVQLAAIFGG